MEQELPNFGECLMAGEGPPACYANRLTLTTQGRGDLDFALPAGCRVSARRRRKPRLHLNRPHLSQISQCNAPVCWEIKTNGEHRHVFSARPLGSSRELYKRNWELWKGASCASEPGGPSVMCCLRDSRPLYLTFTRLLFRRPGWLNCRAGDPFFAKPARTNPAPGGPPLFARVT